MILKCRNVTVRFGELAAVYGLSFDVKEGEVFGIAGPNGAGKTTLFNLITGIYQGSGDILFNGENIRGLRPHRICQIGVARTFQVPQLFSTLPVYQNVRVGAHFGGRSSRAEKEAIRDAIEFVGLTGKTDTVAASLNLLDKKLTMLAAALATNPTLLLLDEPIAGLNPSEIRHSMDMIQKINRELGLTVIIIEHFMKVLSELSHRLMILESGQTLCIGSPTDVVRDEKVIKTYLGGGDA